MKKLKKIIKPKFFIPLSVALVSFEVYLGMVLGYFLGKFFSGPETGQPGKVKSLIFHIKGRRIHLHHWLICFGILIFAALSSRLSLSFFSFGFLGGLMFHGIYCYSDWYKILTKKDGIN